ncbi:FAD/NAD(P)-binding oxidoreductase (plasmid) [Neorhizobium sp. SOG26]|uniref:NAD(P)/FAD-dependent oxidoreductase n=1 Tax=Neorhizobium sp. SOG26 TaxID=2060726 RepID=UPI000E57A850|nr:NAD(P)/FAD-dependent oxidoreductase [Neorhizobium sp. SOG26]AXV17638.1 FAD/NAD(P)-binding oxidoreductase [Neorhizobium sp. SOG26]
MSHDVSALPGRFDVAVIGAGVVGCALARRFALAGARVAVIEKAVDILDGASKGNSAILHTGFDAPVGSLEQSCVAAGYAEYLEIHGKLGLPLIKSGALVVAWSEEEEALLPTLMEQAHQNGVADVEALDETAMRSAEPGLGKGARVAFRVPREYLIDPWSAPYAYLLQAIENGAEILRGAEVTAGRRSDNGWVLETSRGTVDAGLVINAAGLWGDLLDEKLIGRRDFHIKPRKGQFVVYDKPAAKLASHILLPVPNKITKGVVVCRTAFGNLLVGPTAEDQDDREHAVLVTETLEALKKRGEEILPALKDQQVTAIYAGLRPATEFKDYRITAHDRTYITVGGIRSTGLSAALGIAQHVLKLAELNLAAPADPVWPTVPNISEFSPRDWQTEGHGGIVCHCELATKREIQKALDGPLPTKSLAGLKRRTRVTMGRCQGFFCSAEIARLTEGHFDRPMAEKAQ